MSNHGIEADIGTSIDNIVVSKNQDSQDFEFRPTLPDLYSEQRYGMILRDMYLSLKSFRKKLDSKVQSCSIWGLPVSIDCTKSHSGLNEKTLAAPSLDLVLNGLFQDQQVRWKQGETSLGTKHIGGLVMVMLVPPKRGLSQAFKHGSF